MLIEDIATQKQRTVEFKLEEVVDEESSNAYVQDLKRSVITSQNTGPSNLR